MDLGNLQEIKSIDKNSGIYIILNKKSGKFYIGRANNLKDRKTRHIASLIRNDHANKHLQRSFNLYGKKHFIWLVAEKCKISILRKREQFYLDEYFGSKYCYNINPNSEGGGFPSRIFSEETLKKMKLSHLGKKQIKKREWHSLSKSHKKAISDSIAKKYKVLSPSGKVKKIFNLKSFCNLNNLIPSCMYEVISGKTARKSHKGYRNICELGVNS